MNVLEKRLERLETTVKRWRALCIVILAIGGFIACAGSVAPRDQEFDALKAKSIELSDGKSKSSISLRCFDSGPQIVMIGPKGKSHVLISCAEADEKTQQAWLVLETNSKGDYAHPEARATMGVADGIGTINLSSVQNGKSVDTFHVPQ